MNFFQYVQYILGCRIMPIDNSILQRKWLSDFISWCGPSNPIPDKGYCWLNPFRDGYTTFKLYPQRGLIMIDTKTAVYFVPACKFMRGVDLQIIYKTVGIKRINHTKHKKIGHITRV